MERTLGLIAVLATFAGCGSEVGLTVATPEIAVLPDSLDFGEIVVDRETGEAELFVQNNGLADLVSTLGLIGDDAGAFGLETTEITVGRDESVTLPITFTPDAVRMFSAEVAVTSPGERDPDRQLITVPLVGVGRVPYAPDIDIARNPVTFDAAPEGSDDDYFVISNVGDADLVLGSIRQEGAGSFAITISDPSGSTIPPGGEEVVPVTYSPIHDQGDSGTFVIPSNDPDEAEVIVDLVGNGGGDFEYPEAIIDCPGEVGIAGPVVVTLDGSASTDPQGRPLTYQWALVRRPSAGDPLAAPMPVDQPITDLRIDAAGIWEVTLTVTNDAAIPTSSVPSKCVLDAVPTDDVYVEVSWGGSPNADLDLHLARDGADFYTVPGDCSWCNRSPDWGVAGDPEDDPFLEVIDDDGLGPEITTITIPADGVYHVMVHHYHDDGDGDVTADVQVFTRGTRAWEGAMVLGRNEVWDVGQINWPDGTFGATNLDPWDAVGIRECR